MGTTSANNLLNQVNQIHSKYDEISRITGRNYNVFDILGLSKNEVRLHSKIIAQLLNPKGSHGQGSMYLELFIQILNNKIILLQNSDTNSGLTTLNLDTKTTRVSVEEYIGKQTEDEGGRLDIICQDRYKNRIIIENKIDAPDQEKQLLRYRKYDKNAALVYLNLNGEEPSKLSLGDKSIGELGLVQLTYKTDIKEWLELCVKESYYLPSIRETIFQYLNTIKKITNQIEIKEMDNDIVKLLIDGRDKITSAILIEKSLKDAKKALLMKFGVELTSILTTMYAYKAKVEMKANFGDRYKGITVHPLDSDRVFFQLAFLGDGRDFYLEIFNHDNMENGKFKLENKNQSTVSFYKEELNSKCNFLGQFPNVTNAWIGDWVCRYSKLDQYFLSENGWGDLADQNFEIANTVANEISPIIDTMLLRNASV